MAAGVRGALSWQCQLYRVLILCFLFAPKRFFGFESDMDKEG